MPSFLCGVTPPGRSWRLGSCCHTRSVLPAAAGQLLAALLFASRLVLAQDSALVRDSSALTGVAPLSLADALQQARAHNPLYRQMLNDTDPARWALRNAYGALLPSLSVSAGLGYRGAGQQTFGGTFFRQGSPSYNSDYNLGVEWQLSGSALAAPRQARAVERAVGEEIAAAAVNLEADITTQYLTALQAAAQVAVAAEQLKRSTEFFTLAAARQQVGQVTLLDVRQAEVTRGRAEVALLRARQTESEAKLELLRQMGVVPSGPVQQLALTDTFPVVAPKYDLEQLLTLAAERNPSLRALRARGTASEVAVRAARSEFFPTLSFQAGWSGFTQQFRNEGLLFADQLQQSRSSAASCEFQNGVLRRLTSAHPAPNGGIIENCNSFAGLTPDGDGLADSVTQAIHHQNDIFPFRYRTQPFQASLRVSLPIFTGFSRSRRVAEARAAEADADESVRARALQVRTDVHSRSLALETAYAAIRVAAANREAARQQRELAQERYRVGVGAALEVADAQNAVQQAEGEYVNAVYDYHKARVALEAALGQSLP